MTTVAAINNLGAYAHNPRGNLWFNDDSTYGRKLLMKMGWSKGKGLGKNEDGIKENLSVKFRNTNSGLGYKDDSYADVMKTEYESILKNLTAEHSQNGTCSVNKGEGHEKKSKVVRGRLRYPKLFYGKDVTKYSEQDMKSIFICSQPSKDSEENHEDITSSQRQKSKSQLSKDSQAYSSKLSISDYFAKKMKEKKSNLVNTCNNLIQQQASLNSEIAKRDILTDISHEKKTKKRKETSEININEKFTTNLHVQQTSLEFEGAVTCNLNSSTNKSSCKKRKKTSEMSINGIETTLHADDNIHESVVPSKKKQKLSEDLFHKVDVSGMKMDETSYTPNKKQSQRYENRNSFFDAGDTAYKDKISCQIELSNTSLKLNKSKKKWLKTKDRCISSNIVELPVKKLTSKKDGKFENFQANVHPTSRSVEVYLSMDDINCSKKKKCKSRNSCTSDTVEFSVENPQVTNNHPALTSVEEKSSSKNVSCSKKKKCYKNKDRCTSADTVEYLLENSQVKNNHCSSASKDEALSNNDGSYSEKKKYYKDRCISADTVELPLENLVPVKGENVLKKIQVTIDHSLLGSMGKKLLNNDVSCSNLKKMKLKKLKSCLKSKSGKYSIKNVSFNQNVSYRVIDTDYESVVCLSDVHSIVQDELIDEVFDVDKSDSIEHISLTQEVSSGKDSTSCTQQITSDEQKCDDDSCTEKQKILDEKSEEDCLLSSLPSTKSSHYNYWIESQRQALKMKLYKSMLRRIKKHEVLRTTNMLALKGYGNWGFT